MHIFVSYIHVAYILSHATKCHVQLVLSNYINLSLHVLFTTKINCK